MLVETGLVQMSGSDCDFPKTYDNRHFSDDFYMRKLPNGECSNKLASLLLESWHCLLLLLQILWLKNSR
jgi:hypothetical protein